MNFKPTHFAWLIGPNGNRTMQVRETPKCYVDEYGRQFDKQTLRLRMNRKYSLDSVVPLK